MTLSKRRLRDRLAARNALIVQQIEDAELAKRGEAWTAANAAGVTTAYGTRSKPPGSRVRLPAKGRLGIRLRDLREARGMRQLDVARASGLSQAQVSNLECGRHTNPERETVLALAETFKLDATETAELLVESGHSINALLTEPVVADILGYLRDAGDDPTAELLRRHLELALTVVRREAS